MQLDAPERGFAHRFAGPLDMRMDPTQGESAAALIARLEVNDLRRLLAELGEVRRPGPLARRLVAARAAGRLSSMADLRAVVEPLAGREVNAELSRVCQALRIAVNDELGALDALLRALPDLLAPGGVAVAISYHSLEDRRVKRSFRAESRGCVCPPELPVCACGRQARLELLTPRALRPGAAEIAANPRARSARLRAARRPT